MYRHDSVELLFHSEDSFLFCFPEKALYKSLKGGTCNNITTLRTTCFEYMQPLFTFHQLDTKTLAFFRQNQLVIHLKSVQQLLYLLEKLMKRHCHVKHKHARHFFFFFIHPLLCDLSIIPRLFTNCQLACQDRNYSPNRWLNPHDFSWAKRRLPKAKLWLPTLKRPSSSPLKVSLRL